MVESRPTQEERVLEYINKNGSITLLQAIKDIGVLSLSSRISSLTKQGYPIVGKMVKVSNRWGETCTVKRYYMKPNNEVQADGKTTA